jgi:hypothetical protein
MNKGRYYLVEIAIQKALISAVIAFEHHYFFQHVFVDLKNHQKDEHH